MLPLSVTAGAVPFPVRDKVCGLPVALSATETVALRPPVAVGVNVAAILQVPPAATDPISRQSATPGPFGATSWKSPGFVPVSVTLVIVTADDALLVSTVVICALATPVRWLPNNTVVGLKFTVEVTPAPLMETDCVDPATAPASSVITSVTGPYERTVVGAKVTTIVQLDPAVIAEPFAQVVPCPAVPMPKNDESVLVEIAKALLAARFKVSVPLFFTVNGSVAVRLIG